MQYARRRELEVRESPTRFDARTDSSRPMLILRVKGLFVLLLRLGSIRGVDHIGEAAA